MGAHSIWRNSRATGRFSLPVTGNVPMFARRRWRALDEVFRELGASANTFAVVFLTLEPEVDEREDLLDFVHGFHRDFRAITGSRSSIEAFASRLRISFERGTGEQDKDRIISHLSRILLINPQGELAGSFPPGQDEALIKASLLRLMRR